jgi:hypothetical protein
MLAIHDRFSRPMRNRLKITCMGLGLVRLLQDARRFEEARTTLYVLENGFQHAIGERQSDSAFSPPPQSYFTACVSSGEPTSLESASARLDTSDLSA